MKSFVPEEIEESAVRWMIGPDEQNLEMVDHEKYLYRMWSIGKKVYVSSSVEDFSLSEYYREYCSLNHLEVEFVLSWYSPETSLRGVVGRYPLKGRYKNCSVTISDYIDGDLIAGVIELNLDLIVCHNDDHHFFNSGLKLGGISSSIIIEGHMAQFPIQIISFKAEEDFKAYKNSLYKLARDLSCSDYSDLFYNTYMLFLNSDSPYIGIMNGEMSKHGTPEQGLQNILISSVYSDIVRDISDFAKKLPQEFKFSDWIDPKKNNGEKRDPAMLGSVYYNIVLQIGGLIKKDVDAAYEFVVSNPEEAAIYLQSAIFSEVNK